MKKTISFLLSLVMVIGIITSVPVCVNGASSGKAYSAYSNAKTIKDKY